MKVAWFGTSMWRGCLLWVCAWLVFACDRGASSETAPRATPPAASASVPQTRPVSDDVATAWRRPLLYRVIAKPKPFYVFGTIHLPSTRLATFPTALETAMNEADVVLTEVPMTPESQAAAAAAMTLPAGKTLADGLPPLLYADVAATFGARGVPVSSLQNLKPWVVTLQLAVVDRLGELAKGKALDAEVYDRALLAGRKVGGLETVNEQLSVFDALTQVEQIEMLGQMLEYRGRMQAARRDVLRELMDAYVAGDETLIDGLTRDAYDPDDALSVKLFKRLFTDRNRRMVTRMLARTRAARNQTYLFAVGAGHLVGQQGIVAQLEGLGLKVERVE